jgi:AAA family ATP:ADP antiporter
MAFFILCDLIYAQLLRQPGSGTVWSFYLFGDLFSTLMVATFFAFLNDSVTPEAAKRLYGFIGLGAVIGGVVGSSVLGVFVASLAAPTWLYLCGAIGTVIVVVALAAGRLVGVPERERADREVRDDGRRRNPAIEGAVLVLRSPYLLSIAAIVGIYEIVSTVMDFQFTSTVAHYLDGHAIETHLSRVFAVTNVLSMLVQFFLTPMVMQTWGIGAALLVLPATTAVGSGVFLARPTLWAGSLLNTADNAFSYSINQSAKEALYVPTSEDEKYKAKAFIDMFVQRAAKAVAVGISLAMALWFHDFAVVRWLSLVTLVLIAVWIVAARYAGRAYPGETSREPRRRAA